MVPAGGEGLRAARRDHEGGSRIDVGDLVLAVGDDDTGVREGASELVGRALAPRRRHAQALGGARRASPRRRTPPAPRALGNGTRPTGAQRTGAMRAARRRAAVGAHQHRGVPGSCHLHQNGSVRQRLARRGERRRRDPRAPRLALARRRQHDPGALTTAGRDLAHPAECYETLDVGRPCQTDEDQRAGLELLPDEGGVSRMHTRAQRLREQRIAVVPEEDGADVMGRGVHARPIAHHDARHRGQQPKVPRVALGARAARIVPDDRSLVDPTRQDGEDMRLVSVVGHDDDRALAPRERKHGQRGEQFGPGRDVLGGAGRGVDREALAVLDRTLQIGVRRRRLAGPRRGTPRSRPVRQANRRPPRPSRPAPSVSGSPAAGYRSPTPRPDRPPGARGRRAAPAAPRRAKRHPRARTGDGRRRSRRRARRGSPRRCARPCGAAP